MLLPGWHRERCAVDGEHDRHLQNENCQKFYGDLIRTPPRVADYCAVFGIGSNTHSLAVFLTISAMLS
jgi:hypothetical protein